MSPTKSDLRLKRKRRIRAKVRGSALRPRLSVFVSLTRITAQLIDDDAARTIAMASSDKKTIAAAKALGEEIGKKAKDAKVTAVVLDRNGRKYHGRIKALADAARASGLTF